MSLRLAIDNNVKHLNNMTSDELAEFQQMVMGLPYAEQTALYGKVINPSILGLQMEITKPDWLKSDFVESTWQCKFGEREKIIDFNIYLEDGSLLTAPSNAKFLYTIKYWLCALSHPINTGGNLLKPYTYHRNLVYVLTWVDAVLIRSDRFQPAKYGFRLLTIDDIRALLRNPYTSSGFYQMDLRITDFLKVHSVTVSDNEITKISNLYPTLLEVSPERKLDLTDNELIKARVWLLSQGAYVGNPLSADHHGNCNGTFFSKRLNANTLHGKSITMPSYPELRIIPIQQSTEYKSIPVVSYDKSDAVSMKVVKLHLAAIKSLCIVDGKQFVGASVDLSPLTVNSIESNLNIKNDGRFRTLPAPVVFASLRNAFEFTLNYADDILQTTADFLIKAPDVDIDHRIEQKVTKALDKLTQQCCSTNLRELGVKRWRIVGSNGLSKPNNYFVQLRKNIGLLELYELLMGCIQMIIGTMMARRMAELIKLEEDCLHPQKDPTLPENEVVGFFLDFYNRKSGAGEDRENLLRPILLVGAKLLWKLRGFRERLITAGMVSKKTSLLLGFNRINRTISSISEEYYNQHFDIFCDYFSIQTIEIKQNNTHRYYIRQHQLRRFFAMAFFWGSRERGNYDGLDTLRYFLGHTDADHLYHYITESTPGVVLRGVKAEALVHGINSDRIAGIEKLRELLKTRFGVSDVTIEALEEAVKELEDEVENGYLTTEPPLDELRRQIEQDVEMLLQDGTIDLEPEFCTVTDTEGETTQVVNLVLRVKEEDGNG